MSKQYDYLREMALNEDRSWHGKIRIFLRRHKLSLAAIGLLVAYLFASYYDERDKRLSLERNLRTLSTVVLQKSCLVTQDQPVGMVLVGSNLRDLYSTLTEIARIADGERAALMQARQTAK